jgi:hypothetical protein
LALFYTHPSNLQQTLHAGLQATTKALEETVALSVVKEALFVVDMV